MTFFEIVIWYWEWWTAEWERLLFLMSVFGFSFGIALLVYVLIVTTIKGDRL